MSYKFCFMSQIFNKKILIYFFGFYILAIVNGYLLNYFLNNYSKVVINKDQFNGLNSFSQFCIIIFISPIVETVIFQYLPNILLNRLGIRQNLLLVLFPSLLFGFIHFYNLLYFLMGLIAGILLNSLYIVSKSNSRFPIFIVTIFHLLYNLWGYVFIK